MTVRYYDRARMRFANPDRIIAPDLDGPQYLTQGAMMAVRCLADFGVPPSELQHQRMLDFGAGTGRVARVLSSAFGEVVAYEPSDAIREAGAVEVAMAAITTRHVRTVGSLAGAGLFGYAIALNVFEHLSEPDGRAALALLVSHLLPGARAIVDFRPPANPWLTAAFGTGADGDFRRVTTTAERLAAALSVV